MAKAPVFDFTLGNKTLDELGIQHIIKYVEFEEQTGKFDSVTMELMDDVALSGMWDLAKHGNVLQLSMGYYNDIVKPMCLAFLSSIEPSFENRTVKLFFAGYLKAMSVGEKDRSLSGRTIREVVTEIVADYEPLVVGTIESGDVMISSTNTQSKQSDLSFLEGIASTFGMRWKIEPTDEVGKWALSLYKLDYDKTKALNVLPIHAHPEKRFVSDTKALQLKTFHPKSNIFGVSSSVEIRSNNPNQPVTVESTAKNASSEPTVVRGSEVVATVFGEVVRVHFYENVTDEDAAQTIADQLMQMDELAFVTATNAQMQEGVPDLRLGDVRHIVPHGITLFEKVFEGDYLLTGTRHRVDAQQGYDMWINCSMNSLSMPEPPPESGWGSGGGSGQPVLIYIYPDGTAEGWYMVVSGTNQISKGTHITQAEIEANSYWMEHVMASAQVGRVGTLMTGATIALPGVVASGDAYPMQTMQLSVLAASLPAVSTVTEVHIDWPEEWNTYGGGSLATPVRHQGAQGFIEQSPGFEGWGPRQAYAQEPEVELEQFSLSDTMRQIQYQNMVNRVRGQE